jgi:3-hydroxyisobutyrate dehydrogenase
MTDAPRIALLGTGTMGAGMARSILRAGLPLTVWNRHAERARPLAEDGAAVADDVAEAVRDADVVVTMLFDADAVAEVMEQAAGAMRDAAVWVQSATVGREGIARLARFAGEHDLTMVDAPMVGTKQPAEDGKLTVLAAGPAATRDTVQPLFDAVGAKTVWLGDEPGAASAMKLVANGWVAVLTAGTAQGIAQARAFGLDPAQFLETVSGGAADSPYLQAKGRAILEERFDPQFGLDGLLKDLRLIRTATADAGVPTTVVDALVAAFERASDEGHGREDIAAVAASFVPAAGAPAV